MNSPSIEKKILILGVGNILRMDDGAGPSAIKLILDSRPDIREKADCIDGGVAGYDLINYMQNRELVIVIDAFLTSAVPGSVYRLSPAQLQKSSDCFSQHGFGLLQALSMLQLTGSCPRVEIIGIVPADVNSLHIGLSPKVAEALPGVIDLIGNIIYV